MIQLLINFVSLRNVSAVTGGKGLSITQVVARAQYMNNQMLLHHTDQREAEQRTGKALIKRTPAQLQLIA